MGMFDKGENVANDLLGSLIPERIKQDIWVKNKVCFSRDQLRRLYIEGEKWLKVKVYLHVFNHNPEWFDYVINGITTSS